MPKRTDLRSILIVGSGPIVIGQACEFDYSGTQACRVLQREGYRVVLVNSNPATIMTDPEFSDATYVEPLHPEIVERIIAIERPDALLPTVGGQTGINLTLALEERGVLARYGVEVLGASVDALRLGEDRLLFKEAMERHRARGAAQRLRRERRRGARHHRRARLPGDRAAQLHARRRRRRRDLQPRGARRGGRAGARGEPGASRAARAVGARLEGIRARGDARPRRQRDRGLLGRERRPDGHPHRGLDHRRAAADALRPRVPGDARRRVQGHSPRRRRHRRLEHPVRRRPGDRASRRDRDEPAGLAQLGARLEGHRLSDREDRRPARGGLHAGRDPQRHHRQDLCGVRAHARLHGRQDPALGLREVPARAVAPRHVDEVGGRGDGDRVELPRSAHEGDRRARARSGSSARSRSGRATP